MNNFISKLNNLEEMDISGNTLPIKTKSEQIVATREIESIIQNL